MYGAITSQSQGGFPPFSAEVPETPTWLELWASGRYELHLTESEFWGLTLKELNALIERYTINQDWLNYRMALICSVMANTARDSKRKRTPYTPNDFLPRRERKQQTTKQMLATAKMLNTAFGGNVLKKDKDGN